MSLCADSRAVSNKQLSLHQGPSPAPPLPTWRVLVEGSGPSVPSVSASLAHSPVRRKPSGAGTRWQRQLGLAPPLACGERHRRGKDEAPGGRQSQQKILHQANCAARPIALLLLLHKSVCSSIKDKCALLQAEFLCKSESTTLLWTNLSQRLASERKAIRSKT